MEGFVMGIWNTKKIGDEKYTWWYTLWSSGHTKKDEIRSAVDGYSQEVKEYIKRCQKCKELRNFTQTTLHSWPKKVEPSSPMNMDHAYITGVGLLSILVDWPEVIRVPDKKSSTVKQILRVIFSRNGIPKTLVPDNAPEFCDEDLSLWLEKIGYKSYKTPPCHPQSNGLTERMAQTIKTGLKACSRAKRKK